MLSKISTETEHWIPLQKQLLVTHQCKAPADACLQSWTLVVFDLLTLNHLISAYETALSLRFHPAWRSKGEKAKRWSTCGRVCVFVRREREQCSIHQGTLVPASVHSGPTQWVHFALAAPRQSWQAGPIYLMQAAAPSTRCSSVSLLILLSRFSSPPKGKIKDQLFESGLDWAKISSWWSEIQLDTEGETVCSENKNGFLGKCADERCVQRIGKHCASATQITSSEPAPATDFTLSQAWDGRGHAALITDTCVVLSLHSVVFSVRWEQRCWVAFLPLAKVCWWVQSSCCQKRKLAGG